MSTKTMKELCVKQGFSFVFGCGLSASAGNLLEFVSQYCKKLTNAGKWTEITVILPPSYDTFPCKLVMRIWC